ncbi:HoxN/HupN/NixA family nickel/cobalt transporter [Arthrobacter oryzae]|uniref:HoxN/HupN/NixA family nickel/cobalt transporter n=1 Tax=Arthrobacter oryzae TaxID=409290 RepID=UPI0028655090|nr:HoxN/HupN/NixA family nickel/cobalt transporter [Arthrobacter oryzae]MDR6506239.1 high-affinity nickel-transport protein [Arthrobacter oryzae]
MKQPEAARPGRIRGATRTLSGREWASIGGMAAFVAVLHVLGWGVLAGVVAPGNLPAASTGAFGVGLGVAAYTLGLRHAFDADHIAAIDNITRKLRGEGKRSMSVGFWFSLGHSSVVFGLCALLAAGIRSLADRTADGTADLHAFLGLVGTAVSGLFLLCIGVLNLAVLRGIIRSVLRMRTDGGVADLAGQSAAPGLLYRVFGRATRLITRPWQVYGVGLLFGLGFDTATEVSLLILAGGAAASALPWYAILTLPILFAAGMSLLDSLDGCLMNFAYGWALSRPVRRVYYNIVITALSVAVALGIGSIELISILVERAGISTGPLAAIGGIDLDSVGYTVVALFVCTWILALGVWRFGHIEERWAAPVRDADTSPRG